MKPDTGIVALDEKIEERNGYRRDANRQRQLARHLREESVSSRNDLMDYERDHLRDAAGIAENLADYYKRRAKFLSRGLSAKSVRTAIVDDAIADCFGKITAIGDMVAFVGIYRPGFLEREVVSDVGELRYQVNWTLRLIAFEIRGQTEEPRSLVQLEWARYLAARDSMAEEYAQLIGKLSREAPTIN